MKEYEIVVVGTSLGGLTALEALLKGLPGDFNLPIVVVQHRDKRSDGTLGMILERYTGLNVCDAEDKMPITRGNVYLAPPNYHLLVERGSLSLSCEGPVLFARPSIDVMFESAADAYGCRTIGVIMTGASADGARGLAAIKQRGGVAIVQQPETAEARAMPAAAIAAVKPDRILPLNEIGLYLAELVYLNVK